MTSSMINLILMMASALTAMAFYTLSERKFLGYMQYRKGPNKPNMTALMVPVADALKLFLKQETSTTMTNINHYLLAPSMMIITSILLWSLFPHNYTSFFMKFSLLYFLSITSINIYATFLAGWSSSSKWGLLGSLRGVAQTISYEVSMSLILICFVLNPMSLNLLYISQNYFTWTVSMLIPLSVSWIISILAEAHRAPLDFAEGESELVSGFNIEYKSSVFAMIFMAEYMNIILLSLITSCLLWSSNNNMELLLKTTLLSLIFIWTRGSLPRLRYDYLMTMLWKKILPFTLMSLLMIMSFSVSQ